MKRIVFFTVLLVYTISSYAQVGINTDNSSPDASAILDVKSEDKGMLVPRMQTAQRTSIATPATGLLVFDTDTGSFWFYNGTDWTDLSLKDDADADPTNEYNTSITLNGTNLETTDGGGTIATDLSGLQDKDWLRTNGTIPTGIGNVIYRTGNVGIGANASNPAYAIDVRNTFGPRLRVYSEDDYFAGYLAKNSTREFFMGVQGAFETNDASSGFHIYDNTAGQMRFVIDMDGDVGIGEANPNAKLHINGDFRLVDGTQGAGKFLTSDADGFASWATHTDNVDDADADPTNEIELPAIDGTNGQFLQTDGAGTVSWATHTDNVDDADADPTNELITGANLNGTMLEITDNGGTTSVELNSLLDEDWNYYAGTGNDGEVYHLGQVSVGVDSANINDSEYRLYAQRQSADAAAIMGYNGTSRGMLGVWDGNFTDADLPNVQSAGVLGYCPDFANNSRAAIYGYTENAQGVAYGGMFQALGTNAQVNYGIYVNAANSTNDNFSGYFLGNKSYFQGNIGLGTTQPADILHASSGSTATKLRAENTGTGGAGLSVQNTLQEMYVGLQNSTDPNPGKFHIYDETNATQLMEIQDNQQFKFYGDVTTHGTILAGSQNPTPNNAALNGAEGLVMPGTTSDYIVSVQDGNGRVQHKWNATYGTNETFVVGGEDAAFIDFNATASNDNAAWIEFKHADGAFASAGDAISWNTQMIINQGGEVGINETSPDDMLHITSGGNGTRVRTENSGNGWAGIVTKNSEREIFLGVQGAFDANPGEFHIFDNTAGARRMVIDAAGEVGIGRNNPSVKLDVNGSVNCTGGTCSSDIRWKKDIKPLSAALSKLMQLQGVTYYWKTTEFPDRDFTNDKQIGLIAQEVEKIYPELVKTDNEGFKALDYMSLTAILLEGIKEQQNQLDEKEERVLQLEKELNELKANNNNMNERLENIEMLLNISAEE